MTLASLPHASREPPSSSDALLWDLWVGRLHLPALAVADELGVFALLEREPLDADGVARALHLDPRGTSALLGVLVGLGLASEIDGRFRLTQPAREFLLPTSPYCWSALLAAYRKDPSRNDPHRLAQALRAEGEADDRRVTRAWSAGHIDGEQARLITDYMHSHSFVAAMGFARHVDLTAARRLLDVGAGSGCFSIAAAFRNPHLTCTLLDLAPVCARALEYVRHYELHASIHAAPLDFWNDPWPLGHDAVLLSNVLHDWERERCLELLARAHACLEPGGRVYVHEIIATEHNRLMASALSLGMFMGTQGRQWTGAELGSMLARTGFADMQATHTSGHFWTVSARKPPDQGPHR